MIDLHCHYLPGVDDGAPDLESALALVRASYANGVHTSVLTPHIHPGRWNNFRTGLTPRFESFRHAVERAGIPMTLHLGAEVHLMPESLRLFEARELPAIGRWDDLEVVLLEFPDAGIPAGALNAVEFFLRRGCVPLLAHPERNKGVMRAPEKLRPFVELGCLVQLTAASVCGWFGAPAHQTAHAILEAGWATVVATDSHNLRHRPPVLAQAREVLMARYGAEAAQLLTEGHPRAIVGAAAPASTLAPAAAVPAPSA